ncbi:MAG: hypothetical protein AAGB00_04110 [Planctomycetota bacterium]
MNAVTKMLFPLLGYLCVATVISTVGGYAYLRQTDQINDEKLFRIAAIVHGIDLDEIAEDHNNDGERVPEGEPSYAEQQRRHQQASLQIQAKQNDLMGQISNFEHLLKRLKIQNSRYQQLRDEVEAYLKLESQRSVESGRLAFRDQLKSLDAKRQAKPLLVSMIQGGEIDEVILALNGLPKRTRDDILKAFNTPEDLEMLGEVHRRILSGSPVKPEIDRKLEELERLKQADQ